MRRTTPLTQATETTTSPRGRLLRPLVFGVAATLSLAAPISAMAAGGAPTANNDQYTAVENHGLVVRWADVLDNDHDAEGDPFGLDGFTQPSHGSLVSTAIKGSPYSVTYTPTPGYKGPDSFQYTIVETTSGVNQISNVATIDILVGPNQAPTGAADRYTAVSGKPMAIGVPNGLLNNDRDAERDTLTVTGLTQPEHGGLTLFNAGISGAFTYTSDDDYVGLDSFRYRPKDAFGAIGDLTTVTLEVTPGPPAVTSIVITKVPGGMAGTRPLFQAQIGSWVCCMVR